MLRSGLTKVGFNTFTANSDGNCAGKELKTQARKWPQPQRMDIPKRRKGYSECVRIPLMQSVHLPSPALFYSLVLVVESIASEKTSGLEIGKRLFRFCV